MGEKPTGAEASSTAYRRRKGAAAAQQGRVSLDADFNEFAAAGEPAGSRARTDTDRGVWKAPAGMESAAAGETALGGPDTSEERASNLNLSKSNINREADPGGGDQPEPQEGSVKSSKSNTSD